ncbi:MAG: SRPBCC domain-containing protein [Dehalococcoidia bacterium]
MIVHKTVTVARPPDVAFKMFVEEIAQWWPIENFSFLGPDSVLTIEPRVEGRFTERAPDGREYAIGEVLAYEPGARLTVTWTHEQNIGTTEIDIRFTAVADGTRIDLAHSGWERLADESVAARFQGGWDAVLGRYVAHAAAGD